MKERLESGPLSLVYSPTVLLITDVSEDGYAIQAALLDDRLLRRNLLASWVIKSEITWTWTSTYQ